MRLSEILRLVWLNLSQNKFKVILTSIGIVVGSATIMLVLAIGTGGKEEVAEQFKNLNAGAIDISCDSSDSGGLALKCRAVEEALPSPIWAEDPEEVPAAVRLVVPAVAWISADFSDSDRRKRAKP